MNQIDTGKFIASCRKEKRSDTSTISRKVKHH